MLKRSRPNPMLDEPIDAPLETLAPPEVTPSYTDNSGAFIRNLILGVAAIALIGGFAYTQMTPQTSAPQNQTAALTAPSQPIVPPSSVASSNTAQMPVSSAMPAKPILEEKTPASKPVVKKKSVTSVSSRAASSDAPVPAPLLPGAKTPSSAPPPQSVDVNPQTPTVLTPVPEQVAPATP